MTEKVYQPPQKNSNPHFENWEDYEKKYLASIKDPISFFKNEALDLEWFQSFTTVHNSEFAEAKWFEDGLLNACHNCVDRHLATRADQVAIIWKTMMATKADPIPLESCTKKSAYLLMH
jgi:acetyl-CoA synthetase